MTNHRSRKVKSKSRLPDLSLCEDCFQGTCCRDGVEVDLFEVARILREPLDIPRPWFDYLSRDKSFPSGFKFSTRRKNRRCIFQDEAMHCRVYKVRPYFCAEFPHEDGEAAPYYKELCFYPLEQKKARVRLRRHKRTKQRERST